MEYKIHFDEKVEKDLKKRFRKNLHQSRIVEKKLEEISKNPYAYGEPLHDRWKGYYSVHIDSHFVLIYNVDEESHSVRVVKYGEHDNAYGL